MNAKVAKHAKKIALNAAERGEENEKMGARIQSGWWIETSEITPDA